MFAVPNVGNGRDDGFEMGRVSGPPHASPVSQGGICFRGNTLYR